MLRVCSWRVGFQKLERDCVYSVPVIMMLRLKLVRSPVSAATVRVRLAGVVSSGFRMVFCWFHVRVR
jgi:hypothetical protein